MKLVRFDREVLSNLSWLKTSYAKDDSIVLHTLIFVAYDLQYNKCKETLFGTRIWDPYEIAATLGFSTNTLINKIPQSERRELASIPTDQWDEYEISCQQNGRPLWDSALDNAIYILLEQSRVEVSALPNGNDMGSALRKVHVFDAAVKYHKPGRRKMYYEMTYSKNFVTNLARYFSRFDLDLLIMLPVACRVLYLSLMNLRDITSHKSGEGKKIVMKPSVNSLFAWANLNQKVQAENMRQLKNKLATINLAASKLFNRPEGSDPYIKATFPGFSPEIIIEYSDSELDILTADNRNRFNQVLLINLKSTFRKLNFGAIRSMTSSEEFYKTFNFWLQNLNADIDPKMRCLQDTYLMVYGNTTHYEANRWRQYKDMIPSVSTMLNADQFSTTGFSG